MKNESRGTKELVQAALAGDGSAFDQLYHDTIEQMMGLARSMLRNEADALDVLQESYLYAFKALADLREPEYFGTWLYRIVANRCKNFLTRTRPKMFAASLSDDEFGDWDLEDDDPAFQPEESVDDAETQRLVWEMVNALPEDQRVCVLLYHFQDMKVREIARLLDVPDNTVKSRLGYGRKKLLSQAQEIERKGTVLHGVAFFPLLGMAARQMAAETAAASGETIAQGIAAELGAAGMVAGTAATGGGPVAALQSFVGTTAGKAVVAGVVVLAAAGAVLLMQQPGQEPVVEPPPAVIQQEPEPAPEVITEPEAAPEPEPEEESDGFYTVTCLFQNDDGSAVQGIHVMGLRVGEYTVIVDDQPISQVKSYSENEREAGQTTVTPEEAEELGIVRDLEYSNAAFIFSVQQNYSIRLKGDGTNSTSGHAYNAAEPQDHTLYVQWNGDRVKVVRG